MRYVKSVKMSEKLEIRESQQDSENFSTKTDPENLPTKTEPEDSQRQKSPFTASIPVRINRLCNL